MSMNGLPGGRGDAFEKLISTRVCVRFTRSLRRVVGKSCKSFLQPYLGHLRGGVTLTGRACRMKGVKIGR